MSKNMGIAQAVKELGSVSNLASALEISTVAVYQMLNGERPVPAERAVQIEGITNGAVRCEQMRPDVDWSVLRHANKDAPASGNPQSRVEPTL